MERSSLASSNDPATPRLARLGNSRLGAAQLLKIATAATRTLASLHAKGQIHQGVCPSRLTFDPVTCAVSLAPSPVEPGQIRATESLLEDAPAYMAPEQTGRLHLRIDERTDLYGLGAVLYELAAGASPLRAADPLQWIHAHIACAPKPLAEAAPEIHRPLSDIVMKLLAKRPEDRYQSADGLLADLERCLSQLEHTGILEPFPLGEHDESAQLRASDELHGREEERLLLLGAFERVKARGAPEVVLVSGPPGVGKSQLVQELRWPVARDGGFFIAGKFDLPYEGALHGALAGALRELTHRLLSSSEEQLDASRRALDEALGDDSQMIIDMVPELELIVGRKPPVKALSSAESCVRLQDAVRRLLGLFACPGRPLVLFIDNLPAAGGASLDLLKHLITHPDARHLLLIVAGRDAEGPRAEPWSGVLADIERAAVPVARVHLSPARARESAGGALRLTREPSERSTLQRAQDQNRAPGAALDVLTVVKASQALSGELALDKLLATLLRIVIEHAGAERGYFLLNDLDGLRVAAAARAAGGDVDIEISTREGEPLGALLAESVVHYVRRTREHVIIDDAVTCERFAADPYILRDEPRSILCVPIVRNIELRGLLYLENNLISHAFTADRLAMLDLLSAQAAISLENAMLYEDLRGENDERRRAEAALQEKLAIIEEQQQAIRALSTPIIEVWDGVVALPLFGVIDAARAAQAREALLDAVVRSRAKSAIIDLTGVVLLDAATADHVIKVVRAVQLLGARGMVVGIRPEMAQTIVSLGLDLSKIITLSNLRDALFMCMREGGAARRPSRHWD